MGKLWSPDIYCGPYKLPPSIVDRVFVALSGLRNKDSAFRLFVFLARFNASPRRIGTTFPIDRRALSGNPDLKLTVDQIKTAIVALRKNGLIEVVPDKLGNLYKRTSQGVTRIALQYQFSFPLLRVFRYIVSRFPSSPKGRLESLLSKDSQREALFLGDLKPSNVRSEASAPVQFVLKLLKGPPAVKTSLSVCASLDPTNPLHASLQRMLGLMRGRKGELA